MTRKQPRYANCVPLSSAKKDKPSMTVPAPYIFNATVVYVRDGDTVNMVIDRGMWDYCGSFDHPTPIRIYGVNAREISQPGGPEARDHLTGLMPVGLRVVLTSMKPDKFAPRWDAIIETPTVPDVGALLVSQQWASPYYGTGPKVTPPWPRTVA